MALSSGKVVAIPTWNSPASYPILRGNYEISRGLHGTEFRVTVYLRSSADFHQLHRDGGSPSDCEPEIQGAKEVVVTIRETTEQKSSR